MIYETKFNILVTLKGTDINGRFIEDKRDIFSESTIGDCLSKLKMKHNGFFLDEKIWNSICRVERGKVTNKMRFAVYNRDGNRCVYCGSRRNLEVDHKFPIAKGGKTTFDNLQTLCHRCNQRKGSQII